MRFDMTSVIVYRFHFFSVCRTREQEHVFNCNLLRLLYSLTLNRKNLAPTCGLCDSFSLRMAGLQKFELLGMTKPTDLSTSYMRLWCRKTFARAVWPTQEQWRSMQNTMFSVDLPYSSMYPHLVEWLLHSVACVRWAFQVLFTTEILQIIFKPFIFTPFTIKILLVILQFLDH